MRASLRIARALVALTVVLTAFSTLANPAAAQNPVPALTIILFPNQLTAEITASQPGAVTFQGNVTVDHASYERAVVNMQASVSTGWSYSIAPASMVFAGGARQQSFAITVVVPAGASAAEIGQLTVTGRATAAGVSSIPATASGVIIPQPFFRVVIAADTPFIETQYSTQVTIALTIYNEGNVRDTIRLSVRNLDELSQQQWVIVLTRQSFTIGPQPEKQPVQITVGLPRIWSVYPNTVTPIQIQASSQEGALVGKPYEDTVPVFIRVKDFSAPGFDTPMVLLGVLAAAMIMGSLRRSAKRRIIR